MKALRCVLGFHDWQKVGEVRTEKYDYSVSGGWASWVESQQRKVVCSRCGEVRWVAFHNTRMNSNLYYDVRDAREAIDKREGVK